MIIVHFAQIAAQDGATFLERLGNLVGALHPAIVHFPVAAITMAALALTLGWKFKRAFDDIAFFCLVVAALGAAAAVVMGWLLAPQLGYAGAFSLGTGSRSVLFLHRWGGTSLCLLIGALAAWAWVSRRRGTSSRGWKAGVFAAALLAGAVGHWGGTLTHGDLLTDALGNVFAGNEAAQDVGANPKDPDRADDDSGAVAVDFEQTIQPLLVGACLSCHGPTRQKSGYRLDGRQQAFAGGEISSSRGERAIVPGDSDASRLMWMVRAQDDDFDRDIYPMPPAADQRLTTEQLQALRAWIAAGAPWPDGLILESE